MILWTKGGFGPLSFFREKSPTDIDLIPAEAFTPPLSGAGGCAFNVGKHTPAPLKAEFTH